MLRYDAGAASDFAQALLVAAAMPPERAADVADILIAADLLGHDTHGLQLLPGYLRDIESGRMAVRGEPTVLADHGAAITWDGQRLPGPWLVLRALDVAAERANTYGTCTVAIGRSHHIACLAAYLERATDQGLVMLLLSSSPSGASVAPFGGRQAVLSPNPIAAGFPTGSEPVLMDISTSLTTNGLTGRLRQQGQRLPHPWLIDEEGRPSDDPQVLAAPHRGTILPIGGLDAGHKGYGLSLLVEALTAGLSGRGKADAGEAWGASVFLQVLAPSKFGGLDRFVHQTEWLAQQCRSNPPREGFDRVRLPGERGMAKRRAQSAEGLALAPAILADLTPWADKFAVPLPKTL